VGEKRQEINFRNTLQKKCTQSSKAFPMQANFRYEKLHSATQLNKRVM
jgi:hypothetical protein